MKLYLTGFMTSGKSTIGPILANVLGLDYYDLDREIENEQGQSVVEIFEKQGEPFFRETESKILNLLSRQENVVISLGGGTITNANNFTMMKDSGTIIYLKVSSKILYKRLKNKIDRPIFRDLVLKERPEQDFIERIEQLMEKRKEFYEKADLIIDTDLSPLGKTVDSIVKKITLMLNEKNRS